MKFRAIAVATERTNAVGTVELECTTAGLAVRYLGVGAFSEGYAPAALTDGTEVLIPWHGVLEAQFEGERLFLSFDPELTPHHRLLLGLFSRGTRVHHHELYRRKLLVRTAGIAAAVVVSILALVTVGRLSPARGPALAVTVAVLGAAATLALTFLADRLLFDGGEGSEGARLALSRELGAHLPSLAAVPPPQPKPRPPRTLAEFQGLLPRTTFAVVLTLSATGLGAVLMARYLITNEPEPDARLRVPVEDTPGESARASEASAPAALGPARPRPAASSARAVPASTAAQASASTGEPCLCRRPDSPLWDEPLPRLSVLLLSHKVRNGRGDGESTRKKYTELDVAVVNNSNKSIDEVSLLVLFHATEAGKRELVSNRPLFFEGPLLPAQAIKWSVAAEGTEFEIQNPILGTVGDNAEDAAPADRAAALLEANHREVRLHGAMLLTYLGDPRAKEALLRLREALREDEAPYLTRLIDAARELRVCRLLVASTGKVSGCVHNTSAEPKRDIGVKLRALAAAPQHERPTAEPPTLLAEATLALPGELAAGRGVTFSGTFAAGGAKPGAFEAVADRVDLLR